MNRSEKRFYAPEQWNINWTKALPFKDLVCLFEPQRLSEFPDVDFLNQQARLQEFTDFEFVANKTLENKTGKYAQASDLYYEEIIYQHHWIPTRENNWHDWFNALIWLSFPKTKQLLNCLHMADIKQNGLHPRSVLRNRITLFDECGGVLVYEDEAHLAELQQHNWSQAFVNQREKWHTTTKYFVFGHANYEMLLAPHIGLTGKYYPMQVENAFWDLSTENQYAWLDQQLCEICLNGKIFKDKTSLKPLPLLGIPEWWKENKNPEFYTNKDYFRPKRNKETV